MEAITSVFNSATLLHAPAPASSSHQWVSRHNLSNSRWESSSKSFNHLRCNCTSVEASQKSAMMKFPHIEATNSTETELSAKEYFESFLRARQYDGDFISKAADVLWTNEALQADEDKLRQVREKLEKYEKVQAEGGNEEGFLKLTGARIWSFGGNDAPKNAVWTPQVKFASGEDRRMKSLLEYEALKRELSLVTVAVGTACTTYCLLVLSLEAAVSYGVGSLLSLLYLQLLYNHADKVSKNNIAEIFRRRKMKRIGIRSQDVQEFFERTAQGMTLSLFSPRLVFPGVLFALWTFSKHVAAEFTIPYHLQLAPMFLGFFAYKAAALVQVYRDNKDLLLTFDKEQDSA